nr:hypothetical protein GCM10020093_002150 [Planobispora longispora]
MISSELPELLGLCDRIYAMSAGRITGELPRAEATQERLMQFMTRKRNNGHEERREGHGRHPTGRRCSPHLAAKPSGGRLSFNLRQSGIYIAFALIIVLFSILTDGELLSPQNISNIMVQNSYILVLAIGMILIIIAGHIDLSVGSVVALSGAISAVLMVEMDIAWPLALLITLIAGALIGAWQGYWVAYFGIPAFIVTLAGMLVFRALTLTVLGNQGIGPFPDEVRTLSNGFVEGYLGNIGLGPLGGADLITLLVGLAAVAAIIGSQWRARQGRIGYRQSVDSLPVFALKMAAASAVVLVVIVQLARFKNLPGSWCSWPSSSWATPWSPTAPSSAGTSTPSAATCTPRACRASTSSPSRSGSS